MSYKKIKTEKCLSRGNLRRGVFCDFGHDRDLVQRPSILPRCRLLDCSDEGLHRVRKKSFLHLFERNKRTWGFESPDIHEERGRMGLTTQFPSSFARCAKSCTHAPNALSDTHAPVSQQGQRLRLPQNKRNEKTHVRARVLGRDLGARH